MKFAGMVISVSLILFLGFGCSEEEPSSKPERSRIVRKQIQKPKTPRPTPPKPKPAPPAKETKPEPKKAAEIKPASAKKVEPTKQEQPAKPKKPPIKEEKGIYIVKNNDTHSRIAGRKDVYNDPLKWPILYYTNMKVFAKMPISDRFQNQTLPAGARLSLITPDQVAGNLKLLPKKVYAINAISATNEKDIIPSALKLLKNRYPVYITRANIKGVDWLRLRVGFFKDRSKANAEGKKIVQILRLNNSWAAQVGEQELAEFGRYIPVL